MTVALLGLLLAKALSAGLVEPQAPIEVEAIGIVSPEALDSSSLILSDMTATLPPLRFPLKDVGSVLSSVTLGETTWAAAIEGPLVWGEPGRQWKAGGPPITIRVWPASQLIPVVILNDSLAAPPAAAARLQVRGDGGEPLLIAESSCTSIGGKLGCKVPSAEMDVALKVPGYSTARWWAVKPPPHGKLTVGPATLFRGSAFSGYVRKESPSGSPCVRCRVLLRDSASTNGSAAAQPKAAERTAEAFTDSRGFFQMTGLNPGLSPFMVIAAAHATHKDQVRLASSSESELVDPIVLQRQRTLHVIATPTRDPSGEPWRVSVLEQRSGVYLEVASGLISTEEGWTSSIAQGRRYALEVRTSRGSIWLVDVEIGEGRDDVERRLDLKGVSITGRITLGDDPLAATLELRSGDGRASSSATSGIDGEFAATLPVGENWVATVESESPRVVRTVRLGDCCKDGDFVEVKVPDTGGIVGRVVDSRGDVVPSAILRMTRQSGGGEAQSLMVNGAHFELTGLAAGQHWISAEATLPGSDVVLQSEEVSFRVGPDEESSSTTLTIRLRDAEKFSGRVISRSTGGPLTGVRVDRFFPSVRAGTSPSVSTTDSDGRFSVDVPLDEPHLCLLFQGPGVPSFFLGVDRSEPGLLVPLDDVGGVLQVEVRTRAEGGGSGISWPLLVRDNCRVMPMQLGPSTDRTTSDGEIVRTFTAIVGSGPWNLCVFDEAGLLGWPSRRPEAASCRDGVVAPGRTLHLSGPSR